jgi:hypothetical protein
VAIELARHGCHIGEGLAVTYADFQDYGIERHAIAPAIREVVALGFLRIMQLGRAGNAEFRRATLYRPTYLQGVDSEPTDEWRRITNFIDAKAKADEPEQHSSRAGPELQCGKPHRHQCGKSAPNMNVPVRETPITTAGETHTTIYISGRMGEATFPGCRCRSPIME